MNQNQTLSKNNRPLVVPFDEADRGNVDLLSAKGAKLAEDHRDLQEIFPGMEEKISVPDGFILTTEAWRQFNGFESRLSDDLFTVALSELASLEQRTGRIYGDVSGKMPLFVAVRGGAPISLPGALGTVLNLGFNDEVASAMIAAGEDESFVLTSYLTAIRMYGEVVLEIPYARFYHVIRAAGDEGAIPVPRLKSLIAEFKGILDGAVHHRFCAGFETDLQRQLRNAIEAVFLSWMSPIAIEARKSRERPGEPAPDWMGMAAIVQQMVFGQRDEKSLSGVFFTREPRTGVSQPIIEWAPKVQCDKIVSGKLRKKLLHAGDLKETSPEVYDMLLLARDALEVRAKRPLDIEFTVESGRLFLLQRRPMRMTCSATVRAMWDLIDEGKTTIQLASMVINQALAQPEKVLREGFTDYKVLAAGEPITDSADSGVLVFGSDAAVKLASSGEDVILLRRRPYGESDLAINHPRIRGIIRTDGHSTNHEAVSAVAYGKPYLIKTRDVSGKPLLLARGDEMELNPESMVSLFLGKRVFVDGGSGIVGHTVASDFLEDGRSRKKLYVDWEYLKEQFHAQAYGNSDYQNLIDLHYEWELELDSYTEMGRKLAAGKEVTRIELLHAFDTWLRCFGPADRIKAMRLKEVQVEDFDLGPPLVYRGSNLEGEVLKVLSTLMLSTTWWTHWIHEILVEKARARGDTENDVIRDINLKNRTMSLLADFEKEGFHLMKTPGFSFLVLASNFEYEQDLDRLDVGPDTLNFNEKNRLAHHFVEYLHTVDEPLGKVVRIITGEPPMGQGHARIVSIGIEVPEEEFALVCRYLRAFLDQDRRGGRVNVLELLPETGFADLYQIDPFFASYPELRAGWGPEGSDSDREVILSFGDCSFGEYEGQIYGKEDYDRLNYLVNRFQSFLNERGGGVTLRPWHFEVDPFRRHSLIAAIGAILPQSQFSRALGELREFLRLDGKA